MEKEAGFKIITMQSNEAGFKPYRAFVVNYFLEGLKYASKEARKLPRREFFQKHNALLEVLFKKPVKIRVAVMSDDNDHYLGFSILDGDILHFVHVKPEVRCQGIARELAPRNEVKKFSHITKLGDQIWKEHRKEWIFNPFI